jgi:hypothetical protein
LKQGKTMNTKTYCAHFNVGGNSWHEHIEDVDSLGESLVRLQHVHDEMGFATAVRNGEVIQQSTVDVSLTEDCECDSECNYHDCADVRIVVDQFDNAVFDHDFVPVDETIFDHFRDASIHDTGSQGRKEYFALGHNFRPTLAYLRTVAGTDGNSILDHAEPMGEFTLPIDAQGYDVRGAYWGQGADIVCTYATMADGDFTRTFQRKQRFEVRPWSESFPKGGAPYAYYPTKQAAVNATNRQFPDLALIVVDTETQTRVG